MSSLFLPLDESNNGPGGGERRFHSTQGQHQHVVRAEGVPDVTWKVQGIADSVIDTLSLVDLLRN